MPSDERIGRALAALESRRAAFRSAIATTIGELDALLAASRSGQGETVERAASELGHFAAGRIDADRFASLVAEETRLDPAAAAAVGRAREVLVEIEDRPPEAYVVEVTSGDDLVDRVIEAWADLGRVFGAARLVEAARAGQYRLPRHESLMASFGFPAWSRAERTLSPPLVVEIDGEALQTDGLAPFLDGEAKLVLIVRGAAPPAALARLVSPGVFVAQTTDIELVDRSAEASGPAVVAVVDESAARFVHDPGGGRTLFERLSIEFIPDDDPRGKRGAVSAFRQTEDLAHLRMLAELAAPSVAPVTTIGSDNGDETPVEPADRLAAWLLQQAELPTDGAES